MEYPVQGHHLNSNYESLGDTTPSSRLDSIIHKKNIATHPAEVMSLNVSSTIDPSLVPPPQSSSLSSVVVIPASNVSATENNGHIVVQVYKDDDGDDSDSSNSRKRNIKHGIDDVHIRSGGSSSSNVKVGMINV